MDDRAEQLDGLGHAFGKALDRLVYIVAEAVLLEQYLGTLATDVERQAPQSAHEGDRLARLHRRIEAALLGEVTDDAGHFERLTVAEQAALAPVRLDDTEQHAQGGGFPGPVRPQYAVYAAFGNGDVDPANRRLAIE